MNNKIDNIGKIIHFEYLKDNMPVKRHFQLMHNPGELPRKREIGNTLVEAVIPETPAWKTLRRTQKEEEEKIGPFDVTILGIYTEEELILKETEKIKETYTKVGWDVTTDEVANSLNSNKQYIKSK